MKKLCFILLIIAFSNLKAQEIQTKVFNTSINSTYAELGVSYLKNNTILFASSQKIENDKTFSKNRRKTNKQLYLELYLGTVTENGDIIQTGVFSKNINNPVLESDISFSPDNKTVYFTWNNFYNTERRKDSAKWKTLQIVKASINDKLEISNIEPLPFNSTEYSVRSPEISKDGKQLFFVSNMPGNYGGNDIYVVDVLLNNTYSKPRNLGPNINTKELELFPFIDKNNNLYFSTSGHKGLGGLDIFKSEFKNGEYQPAVNLKEPLNSKYDDFAYAENETGKSGFFTSNRKGGIGGVDIYAFKYFEAPCLSNLIVKVFNKESQFELTACNVTIFENNEPIENSITNKNSPKAIILKCNTSYKINIEKEGFTTTEIEFKTSETGETITKSMLLQPLECKQTITGIVLNKETNEPILNAKVSLFQNNTFIESQFTEINKEFSFTIQCEGDYKISIEKERFIIVEQRLISDNILDKNNPLTINLTPIICKQTITGIVLNKETNEPILNAKISLFQNNTFIESQFTEINKEFSFTIQCEGDYKISIEKERFIIAEQRLISDNTLDKNNPLTISLVPIECKQTITGIVLNKETNEPILNAKVSLFQNNTFIESQFTEINKEFSFTIQCEGDYKISVEKERFINTEQRLISDNTLDKNNPLTINLVPIECKQTITGIVLNKETNEPILNAKISLFKNNTFIESQLTEINKEFSFTIKCEGDYKISVEKERFINAEHRLISDNILDKNNPLSISLTPIECKQTITGIVLNKETNKPILNAKVSLFQNNKLIENQFTTNKKGYLFNIKCNANYTIMVTQKGYKTIKKGLKSTSTHKSIANKNYALEPIIEFVTFGNQKTIQTNPIYFDLDSDEIRPETEIELNKVIGVLKSYPTLKIEVQSHTDSRAPDDYNMMLSETRAKASMEYIISQGVDASRISGKGYGETKLKNKCSNNVPCSNADHKINIRTEFIIINQKN